MSRTIAALVGIGAIGASALVCAPAQAAAHSPKPAASKLAGNGTSNSPDVTIGGRYVVFSSTSTNLVPNDFNSRADVFIRDTVLNKTRLVSKGRSGTQSNGNSTEPVVSDDGKIVVFTSTASNLVAGDTNGKADVFRADLGTGVITRVSTSQSGVQATGDSKRPAISGDGKLVAFVSNARNLVAGDTNSLQDVFVRTYATPSVKRVSTTPNGTQLSTASYSPSVSFDGKYVGWTSDPFGDPTVNAWCGSASRTLAVLSRWSPNSARPVVSEAVCRESSLSKVVEPRVNMAGNVGYARLSNDGYAEFNSRGRSGLYDYNYNADYYAAAYWDVGRWADAMVSTTSYSEELQIRDAANGDQTISWAANAVSMSPDGAVIGIADRYDGQVYIWNHTTGASELVSTS